MVVHTAIADGNTRATGDFDPDDARHEDAGLPDEVPTSFQHADRVAKPVVLEQAIEHGMHTGGKVVQIKCLLPRIVGDAKTGAKDEHRRRQGVSRGTLAKELTADLKMLHQRIGIETLRARVDMAATDTQVGQRLERRKRLVEVLLVNTKL